MPKIVRGGAPRVNNAAPAPAAVVPPPARVGYPHNEDDHKVTPDGAMWCTCVCDRCWPTSGGSCPDERGPAS